MKTISGTGDTLQQLLRVRREACGVKRCSAFTLLELMLVVGVLGLICTAATVSFRSKWKAEQARRTAQRVAVTWLKARSLAWREGREWVIMWDPSHAQLRAMPLAMAEKPEDPAADGDTAAEEGDDPLAFTVDLDHDMRLACDQNGEEVTVIHFLPNRRVQNASVVVTDPRGTAWRVQTDWTGAPVMEAVKTSEKLSRIK